MKKFAIIGTAVAALAVGPLAQSGWAMPADVTPVVQSQTVKPLPAVALEQGSPGPGAVTLLVHSVAAVAAVAAQVYADRTPGPRGTLAAVGVIVTIAVVLTVEWLV